MTELQKKVYKELLDSKDGFVTGEYLARRFGVTRTAVWKSVNALRIEGISIEAQTRKGYRILSPGRLSAEGIAKYLKSSEFYNIRYERTVTSTNTVLKEFAAHGAPEGTVLAVSEQIAGRGRFGRSFVSKPECGVFMSFILRPRGKINDSVCITAMAAVAASVAIDQVCGVETGIKWVNDIYLNGRKIVGILTEGSIDLESGLFDSCVVGIGVDIILPDDLPEELMDIVGAIYSSKEEAWASDAANRVAAAILDEFYDIYTAPDNAGYMDIYKRKSFVIGKDITVFPYSAYKNGEGKPAMAVDVDNSARLLVRYGDGTTEWLSSGEVSVTI